MSNKAYPDAGNHSPGILTYIEHFDRADRLLGWAWEARIYGQSQRFPTHEEAMAWCVAQKQLTRSGRELLTTCFASNTLAEEMS